MKVSIIIPALNEANNIVRAISTAWAAGADEVIAVDGGSADDTAKQACRIVCRLIFSPSGRATQLNAGARSSSGDILLFQHADNWFETGAVDQVRTAMRQSRVPGGAFCQRIESPRYPYRMLEWGNAQRARWFGLPYGDQGIFLRRSVFDALGGFPDVQLMEDFLLMKKLRGHGRPVLLPGPIHVDPRRWQQHGVVRQTLRNWSLLTACQLGIAPDRLARFYPP